MAGESFGEVLAQFKGDETPESVFPMLNDIPLCNAVVAWMSMVIKFKPQESCPFDDEASKWEWLWSKVEYDVSKFGTVAGCRPQDAGTMLTRLIGLRLIYPDGTINTVSRQFLGRVILQKITRGEKKEKKSSENS